MHLHMIRRAHKIMPGGCSFKSGYDTYLRWRSTLCDDAQQDCSWRAHASVCVRSSELVLEMSADSFCKPKNMLQRE